MLCYKTIVFSYDGQTKSTMVDIKCKYKSKIFLSVLFLGLFFSQT
jgi:hypothetical protein